MWCMVIVAFADLDVAFSSRMKLFVLISNSKEEHTIYAVEKACDEGKWLEGTYRNVMRGYHTVVIDAGVGQSRQTGNK